MRLEDFLAVQEDNSMQPYGILLCKVHCFHKWYWDRDWHILERHTPCPGGSLHPFGTHL